MHIERQTVALTTDASGDATGYSANVTGRVLGIRYVKDDFADGVDFTITAEHSGDSLWTDTDVNASETVRPIVQAQGTDGADIANEYVPAYLCNERVKVVVANGGDTKNGTFEILIG